ncbi:hypothetical protein FO519_002077 [Halicephalobus sp. NKZ332]|nr:hypothetical protein FO519_002077 [Halicephalobus sp. NKZ332]
MKAVLRLMLLKDFKTMIRSRWYIILIEIVLTLIFIPVIWYSMASAPRDTDDTQPYDENPYGGNPYNSGGYNYQSIYIMGDVDMDFTGLANTVRGVCGASLTVINKNDLDDYKYDINTYIRVEKFSFEEPSFEYRLIQLTDEFNDIRFTKRFDPNPYGYGPFSTLPYVRENPEQYCINMAFLVLTKKTKFDPINLKNTQFVKISSADYKYDTLGDNLNAWTVIMPLIVLIPAIFSVKEVSREKENGVHTYMIVMGMNRYMYYLTHFIFATLKMWIFIIPAGLAVAVYIPSGWWEYLNMIIFGHICIAWAMVASTIFISGTYAMICTLGILALFMIIHFAAIDSNAPINVPTGSLIATIFNPYSAYYYTLKQLEIPMHYGVSLHFFDSWPYYLPCIVPLICLIVHAVFYTLLAFYLDYVLPIDSSPKKHPLFIFGVGKEVETLFDDDIEGIKQQEGRFAKFFENESPGIADVEIRHLIKKWPNGEIAVKDVSFKAYRGQVTALLGHNGAGKSTIFGCLTGFLSPTSGDIKVGSGEEKIGYCPQWDPLFPLLTVEEHLRFYGTLKTGQAIAETEIDEVLREVDLSYARNYRGMALSGGMKRKLCVGMAMIGQSRVLLLDEPTAGMDPMARKGVLDIVEKVKAQRTVILTTHYMDEADLLSDRIIIMAKGELICNGSSNFLKSKFGVGFVLSIAFDSEMTEATDLEKLAIKITDIAERHCPGAKIEGVIAIQFKIILPNGMQRRFAGLFEELESRKAELRINAFGIGVNNLEQVFIKVTDFADPEANTHTTEKVNELLEIRTARASGFELFRQQVGALVMRKIHYTRRHYIKSLLPLLIILPLLALCIDAAVSKGHKNSDGSSESRYLDLNIDSYSKMVVPIIYDDSNNMSTNLDIALNAWGDKIVVEHWSTNGMNYYQKLLDRNLDLPPIGFSILATTEKLIFYYRDVLASSTSLAVQAATDAISTTPGIIKTTIGIEKENYITDGDDNDDFTSTILYIIMALLSSVAFPVIFSPVIFLYIEERHKGSLHLYKLTQMSQFTYWLVAYVTDFIISAFWIIFIVAMLFGFQIFSTSCLPGYLIAVAAVSFALLSQAYFVTFLFANPNTALAVITIYNIVVGFVLYGITFMLPTKLQGTYTAITDALFPMKSLIQVILTMITSCLSKSQLESDSDYTVKPEKIFDTCTNEDEFCSGWAIYSSVIFGCIYVGLIIFMTLFRGMMMKLSANPVTYSNPTEDPDVVAERNKVEKSISDSFAISTRHLRKAYSNGVIAVKDLTLGIPKGECFGLLGVNGAGKSTTFNMLTGVLKPSSGIGYVGKVRIDGQAKFGFCPQQDTVLGDLTVMETMMLFARLNGLQNSERCVQLILDALQMSGRSKNLVQKCSGGEKRRLSIGVALITNCDVIMLDEPTAGVDPRTRRHVWDILIAMRHVGTSEILSSHSMEECEALCTRIGFLNKGELLGIGTTQHLKSRFGNNYMLNLMINAVDENLVNLLDAATDLDQRSGTNNFILNSYGLNFTLAGKCSCPMKIEPVCGSVEDVQYTFMNECVLNCTKNSKPDVHYLYDGVCCRLSPNCGAFESPVCDEFGKVYENQCLFDQAQCVYLRQKKLHLKLDMNSPNCRCVQQCQNAKKEPVCDSEGFTHTNLCSFMNAKCISKLLHTQDLQIDYMGPCCKNLCTSNYSMTVPVCDSENRTHSSLCSFLKYRCETKMRFSKNISPIFKSFGTCKVQQLTRIRDFWHIKGVIVDPTTTQTDTGNATGRVQKRPAGVLYVYNGRLVYRKRHCTCANGNVKELQFEICDIQHVNSYNKFTSNNNGKTYSLNVLDIVVGDGTNSMHVGFVSDKADEIGRRLKEICIKHRQKPKIYQFNSVDVDGVEIDLP